ncbi:pisatin demethylase [Fusarium oxysporum]|uniref:Pisatin demethylase n=2 Tax=Fusarium oxysporum TaxID=5507 RepID=A0A420MD02_FUSOX|nr:pisatin demethylase [Fusarium oxysporum]RKK65938.1 Pisatin demethylase [Fusarium oxysporum]
MLADTGLGLVSELKAKLGWALLQIVPVAFVAYNLLWLIYTSFFSSLRKIPGPFLARISRVWEMRKAATGNIHEIIMDLHKCHGPIVRIGPNRYDFDTMEAAKIIYRIGNTLPKADYYIPFGLPSFPNLFDVQDSARHSAIKKQFAPLYTMTALLSYEQGVDGQTAILKEELQRFSSQKQVIDLPQFLQYYAFDVIGVITVGKSMGMMESNSDTNGACRALDAMWHYASMMAYIPHMHAWWLWLSSLLPIEVPIQGLTEYVERQIMQYRLKAAEFGDDASLKGENNFLAKLLLMEKEGKVTSVETQQAIGLNIGAGSDTTANALSSILYYLYTNPRTLKCLRDELDTYVKVDPLRFQQSQSMPYLQAVIKEALRLHPGVGTQLTRVVTKGGLVIEGQFFPEGTEVGVNGWALYHKKAIFGVDACEFRPERWLETGENLNIGGSFAFGAGSRSCIGKNISILEMSKAIPQIVRNFDIEINQGEMAWKNECWWFVKPEYKATIKPRAS